jgi:hypothetical protein
MASCSFSLLLERASSCGISPDYQKQVVFVTMKDCQRDVTRHLQLCKISAGETIDSEMKLLLARAGKLLYVVIAICVICKFLLVLLFSFKYFHLYLYLDLKSSFVYISFSCLRDTMDLLSGNGSRKMQTTK